MSKWHLGSSESVIVWNITKTTSINNTAFTNVNNENVSLNVTLNWWGFGMSARTWALSGSLCVRYDRLILEHLIQLEVLQQLGLSWQERPQAQHHVPERVQQEHLILKPLPQPGQHREMRLMGGIINDRTESRSRCRSNTHTVQQREGELTNTWEVGTAVLAWTVAFSTFILDMRSVWRDSTCFAHVITSAWPKQTDQVSLRIDKLLQRYLVGGNRDNAKRTSLFTIRH